MAHHRFFFKKIFRLNQTKETSIYYEATSAMLGKFRVQIQFLHKIVQA